MSAPDCPRCAFLNARISAMRAALKTIASNNRDDVTMEAQRDAKTDVALDALAEDSATLSGDLSFKGVS